MTPDNRKTAEKLLSKQVIIITGSEGNIGRVLQQELGLSFIRIDRKFGDDVEKYDQLTRRVHDAIGSNTNVTLIHLAHNAQKEGSHGGDDPATLTMAENVLRTAVELAQKGQRVRVVLASSIHADKRYHTWQIDDLPLDPYADAEADTIYGNKMRKIESLGRKYADKGIEVICIRFGGIGYLPDGSPLPLPQEPIGERAGWFSHQDCANLFATIFSSHIIEKRFNIIYGVSNTDHYVFKTKNQFSKL